MAQWHRNIQDIITIIDACIRAQQDEALILRALAQKLGYSEYYTPTGPRPAPSCSGPSCGRSTAT